MRQLYREKKVRFKGTRYLLLKRHWCMNRRRHSGRRECILRPCQTKMEILAKLIHMAKSVPSFSLISSRIFMNAAMRSRLAPTCA